MPAYCSAACRDADPFHAAGGPECGRPWTVLLPSEALAALRLARRRRQAGPASPASTAATVEQVASLGAHLAELAPGERAQLAALAAVTHLIWQGAAAEAAAAAGGGEDGAGSEVNGGDVFLALCQLQVNGLAVVPPRRRGSADRRALALYPVGFRCMRCWGICVGIGSFR